MAIAFVKTTPLSATTGDNCSGSVTWTAGNGLVCVNAGFTDTVNGGVPSVSGGGTWASDTDGNNSTSGSNRSHGGINSCPDPAGTGATVTVTVSSANGVTAAIIEFSGQATSSWRDATSPAIKTGTSTTPSTNTLANNTSEAVFVAVEFDDIAVNSATSGTGSGWSYPAAAEEEDGSTKQRISGGYKIVSGTTTESSSWTIASSNIWGGLIAVYKARAVGGLQVSGGIDQGKGHRPAPFAPGLPL